MILATTRALRLTPRRLGSSLVAGTVKNAGVQKLPSTIYKPKPRVAASAQMHQDAIPAEPIVTLLFLAVSASNDLEVHIVDAMDVKIDLEPRILYRWDLFGAERWNPSSTVGLTFS
jgi:hypothetical protein